MPGELALVFASSYVTIASRLLEGNEDEVTPLVRQRVYETLDRVVKHYPSNEDNDGLTRAGKMAIQGMTDKNRTVRLSAGSVCR
jgi:serine/threonine-protein kinase ATR